MALREEDIWRYLIIELVPESGTIEPQVLIVDEVTWRSYIRTSLLKLHGIFGTAIESEFIKIHGNKALIRVQKEDLPKFKSSLLVYIADLSILGFEEKKATIQYNDATSSSRLD